MGESSTAGQETCVCEVSEDEECSPSPSYAKEGAAAMAETDPSARAAPPSGTLVETASKGNARAGTKSLCFAASIDLAEHPVRPPGPRP